MFFFLGVATRIPFTSELLLHMDSGQFALALEKFDITLHQPHPPGYFLYVMIGRFLNSFINDANDVFVSLSVFFSGLTIAVIYLLGRDLFKRRIGIVSAFLALSSPSIWFHGEVSLTYIAEAFFSTLIAFFCWKMIQGDEKYLWISAAALGVAGGIRQNTAVFLFPLWLYSIRSFPRKKMAVSLVILTVTSLLWFVPMVRMTGGWDAYRYAFHELWKFHTGGNSVFEKGPDMFVLYFFTLIRYMVYGLGLGIFPFAILIYFMARGRNVALLEREKVLFLAFWCIPVLLFYLLVFISIQNPGYSLIFLPAFLIIAAVSIDLFGNDMKNILNVNLGVLLFSVLMVSNTLAFFLVPFPVSYRWIRDHDDNLKALLSDIKTFDPGDTVVFVNNYIYYSYRHIMYYLPEYRVYNVDVRITPSGEARKIFQGIHRRTILSDGFFLPGTSRSFVAPLDASDPKYGKTDAYVKEGGVTRDLTPGIRVVSGPISMLGTVFPEVGGKVVPGGGGDGGSDPGVRQESSLWPESWCTKHVSSRRRRAYCLERKRSHGCEGHGESINTSVDSEGKVFHGGKGAWERKRSAI